MNLQFGLNSCFTQSYFGRLKSPRINQYKKADWDKIRTELKTFQEHYFCKQNIHTTTEEKWLLQSFLLGLLSTNLLSSIIMFSI
jgi:hypothetical protein